MKKVMEKREKERNREAGLQLRYPGTFAHLICLTWILGNLPPIQRGDIYIYIYIDGVGESGFNCWGVRGPVILLFLFYANVSGICSRSRFSSQPLTTLAAWILLRVWWSIPLVPPFVTVSLRSLAGNREDELISTTFSSLLLFCV